ncbi:hypothetical protein PTSG_04292 [Salpingoeca rosetta]|uniref:Protein arginine N-methyltransferase n=1 Tax=Salpingoeca rosetta (strain ATCC 50818 / BSB-021) TaxID=946362 RepID=F2U756_SALR5|nr:uncharacterized protein PTSG_04292 [Salpingoeca rosetta]EGD83688.1 hypothetical protein PTSG_04292 [Salpingoeca rosetta]|eukprot:XP_004995192.1 hypothetical protein PTSG_04292 [Salpingoeca rosetta]
MARRAVSAGARLDVVSGVQAAWTQHKEQGYDFVVLPLEHEGTPLLDTTVESADWSQRVVAVVSEHDVDNHPEHEKALVTELQWATHLGVAAIMLPLQGPDCCNLASITNPFVHSAEQIATWIHVKTRAPQPPSDTDEQQEAEPARSTWHWWNQFRSLCTPCTRMGLALELSANICDEEEQERWLGEPVKCVVIPTGIFLTNAKGYPVLSRAHQRFVRRLLKLRPQFMLSGPGSDDEGPYPDRRQHLMYLNHLAVMAAQRSVYEASTEGYDDYIEIPLQPLMDHLESQTYEVFEKDPVKYDMYQKAMEKAFEDRKDKDKIVAMVVGAGRGPIVRRALRAAEAVGVADKLTLIALEKNPGAVRILQHYQRTEWGNRVQVFAGDMRTWQPVAKADVLVSELLGSWGDNELSPECLDGAQRFIAEGGVSIPNRYRSFVAPVSTHKNYTELRTHKDRKHVETPYVVLLSNHTLLGDIKELFEFTHPNFGPPGAQQPYTPDNTRFKIVECTATQDGLVHGFAGYFDSDLYADVMISIHPETHTPDMFSWFPMYIPLQTPVYVRKGETIKAAFWRKVSATKVWYEWAVLSPTTTEIHNLAGRSSFIGL